MTSSVKVLSDTSSFPIRHQGDIHNGKVRSLLWLTPEDSRRLIQERDYPVSIDARLGVMIISDRISAFECNWKAEGGLEGVPHKGAALNAISLYWFEQFERAGLGRHHVLEAPHPLLWIVQAAEPIYFEAIARRYLAGSMARSYERGARTFCGISLPEGLEKNQPLHETIITPSTKGLLLGIPGVLEEDDTPISRDQIDEHFISFGLKRREDLQKVEEMLLKGVSLIAERLEQIGHILVDTKLEFGYAPDRDGRSQLTFIDEVGTPDSSRYWASEPYARGEIVEYCKEDFRRFLLSFVDREILLDASRMDERQALAAATLVPEEQLWEVSRRYRQIAEEITGAPLPQVTDAYAELMEVLASLQLLTSVEKETR